MRIGVDYYPEHWDKSRWKTDAEMMVKANIKVVRIGEFTWSLYEPEEDRFEFIWMDEVLDFFHQYGIKVVLCTPSATPPKWMTDQYTDIFQEDIHGNPKIFGTRKHYCFNSDIYRKKTKVLVEMIASRYANHPVVEAWQVDNELGWSNTTRCYCKKCRSEFQNWLKDKYITIDNLNKRYGTVFWSQIYNSFNEVIIPKAGACYDTCHDTQGQNPALLLDFYRFSSNSVIGFMKESVEAIKKYSDKPITTNMLDASINSGTGIDYFKLSQSLDFVSWDNYIEFQWGIAKNAVVSKDHALLRSYKKQPFWVMEQQSGPCGWSKMGPTPTPGKLRLWTYQAVANGADTVVYFRWRACPFGTEEYWHGILNHDGKTNRRYEEIVKVGQEMERLSKFYNALKPIARVAIVKSFDSEWSHSIHKNVENFNYDNLLSDYYKPFYEMGIPVDFVAADEDLIRYSFVLAPALLMVNEKEKNNLEDYVRNGGKLLITFRSGIKDIYNNMLMETVPGSFSELAGVEVYDYDPQFEKQTKVSGVFGEGTAKLWCDIVETTTANTLGVYIEDFYAGRSCFTVNKYGLGEAYYLGCDLDEGAMVKLMKYLGKKANLPISLYSIPGVETVEAADRKGKVLFLMNHNAYPVIIALEKDYIEMITGQDIKEMIRIAPYGVAILN
ncbi:MAG: beta-galactosidase [Anaerocolumna sp.]